MSGIENSLVLAVGVSYFIAGCMLARFGLFWRFPFLTLHLFTEGTLRITDCALAGSRFCDLIWVTGQLPRMFLCGMVVVEVWKKATVDLDFPERKLLWWISWLLCAALALIGVLIVLRIPPIPGQTQVQNYFNEWISVTYLPRPATTPTHWAMLARQYILLACATWLTALNAYLLWTSTTTDHNLTIYRITASVGAFVSFVSAGFVPGGLGYRFLPWIGSSWSQVLMWYCVFMLILIGVLTIFLRSEAKEIP